MNRRGRVWWFLRMRRAYRKQGVYCWRGRRGTWEDAMYARRAMDAEAQRALQPLRR